MHTHDAIVIGSGQAEPFLAVRLAQSGLKVALVEREHYGGTCVNDGCIPAKTLVASARSRVPPDRITGTQPGDMLVHRNIANLVVQTDMNLLSVLQYAVEVLLVQHAIVCGHYRCGGVKAATSDADHGLIDNRLRTVKDTQGYFWPQFGVRDEAARFRRLVDLNVIEQVNNLGKTHVIQDARKARRRPTIHGWEFDLTSGFLRRHAGGINGNHAIHEVCEYHGTGAGAPA